MASFQKNYCLQVQALSLEFDNLDTFSLLITKSLLGKHFTDQTLCV